MSEADKPLAGLRILFVEDEFVSALDVAMLIADLGAEVVGPTGRLEDAMALAETEALDGAILDFKLDHANTGPVVDRLLERGIAVVLATGYAADVLPARYARLPRLAKPIGAAALRHTACAHFVRAESSRLGP